MSGSTNCRGPSSKAINLRVFDRGDGARLYDVHGREYLDGIAGLWVVNAGHGRREIARRVRRAGGAPRLRLVDDLHHHPGGAAGREARRDHAGRPQPRLLLLRRLRGGRDRHQDRQAGPGDARLPEALQDHRPPRLLPRHDLRRDEPHRQPRNETWFGPFMYGVYHVPHPDRYRSDFGLEGEEADIMAAKYVEQEIVNQGPETVAAVIGEPISTAAGVHVPSPKYWQLLREICDRHGVLLIADEVINGFGRTGTMFATEHFGFVPDIMTMAKGLSSGYAPIAAAIVRESVYDVFKENKDAIMGHLLTFGGHPAACAAALKNIEIFERENLVAAERREGRVPEEPARGAARPSHRRRRARARALMCAHRSGQEQRDARELGQDHAFTNRLGELLWSEGWSRASGT